MSIINDIFSAAIWIYLNFPLTLIDTFINNLPITYDYTTYLTPPQIIKLYGYPAESHTVQTDDGYLLELHRIPYGKSGIRGNETRIPVLLFHGMLSSSAMWFVNKPEKSLACRLADEGYDVWLGNARGNQFSRAHVKYTPEQKGFWNFGFHEIGIYDLPASIDYILNLTNNRRLFYVGHSLGGLAFWIMTSVIPTYNDKIITSIALAPGTAIPHIESILFRLLVPMESPLKNFWEKYTDGSFFEHDVIMEILDKYICGIGIFGVNICEIVTLISFGSDPREYNSSLSGGIYASVTSGTSVKVMIQVAQYIEPGLLSNYDYGVQENIDRYGTPTPHSPQILKLHTVTPPLYNLNNVKVPVKIYYGGRDLVINPIDVEALRRKLPNVYGFNKIDEFGHLDFFTAININTLLNDDLIDTIRNFTNFPRALSSYEPEPGIIQNEITGNGNSIEPEEIIPGSSKNFNSGSNNTLSIRNVVST